MEKTIGVIVGRFQVAQLTSGHKEIIEYMLSKKHTINIIILGNGIVPYTKNNPLDFEVRRYMIEKEYPGVFQIYGIQDEPSDLMWSRKLDELINYNNKCSKVTIYGSRDSFIPYYHGIYQTESYQQKIYCSGSEEREIIGSTIERSLDWRKGCIYGIQNKFDTVYSTIDAAIFNDNTRQQLILGKKKKDEGLRFIGGFVDVKDNTLIDAVKREVSEEVDIEIDDIQYITSIRINDFRYRNEKDKIMTNFFDCVKIFGLMKPKDDIDELHIIDFTSDNINLLLPNHRNLYKLLLKKYNKQEIL